MESSNFSFPFMDQRLAIILMCFFIVQTTLLDINCFILVQPINLLISLFITAILFHGRLGVFYQLFSTQFAHKNVNVPCEGYVNFLYLSLQKHNVKALT